MPSCNLPASSDFFKGNIYTRMTEDLHLSGYSQRTVHGYLRSVRQLADDCRCSPEYIKEQQVRKWLLHLKLERELAYGSLRVAFSGITFLLTRTCKRNWDVLSKTRLQNVKSLPEVLTHQQVLLIIAAPFKAPLGRVRWRSGAAHRDRRRGQDRPRTGPTDIIPAGTTMRGLMENYQLPKSVDTSVTESVFAYLDIAHLQPLRPIQPTGQGLAPSRSTPRAGQATASTRLAPSPASALMP